MDRTGAEAEVGIHAAIDIGTNTILMVVGSRTSDGSIRILSDELTFARLGKDVDAEGRIQSDAFERSGRILSDLLAHARSQGASRILACGTSALRDASNRQEYLSYVRDRFRIDIRVLDKEEEAQLTFRGVLNDGAAMAGEKYAVLDIGGGSTELAVGTVTAVEGRQSWNVGAVRITERFFAGDPPAGTEIESAAAHIRSVMSDLPDLSGIETIGVAGTVTTLAAMEMGLEKYDAGAIEGFQLRQDSVERVFHQFSSMDHSEIARIPVMERGREDIILAGVLILRIFMEQASIPSLRVSTRGLRYGILLDSF